VSREDTRQSVLCRVPNIWHSAKSLLCRVPNLGSRQRLTAVSFRTASVQHSVKRLVAESLTLPSAALGKAFFVECPTKDTRQRGRHSAKPRIPVVSTFSQLLLMVIFRNYEYSIDDTYKLCCVVCDLRARAGVVLS
jgi:hypothetical protein